MLPRLATLDCLDLGLMDAAALVGPLLGCSGTPWAVTKVARLGPLALQPSLELGCLEPPSQLWCARDVGLRLLGAQLEPEAGGALCPAQEL